MEGKYSIKLMNRALMDLDGIYAYIAQNLAEPETAQKLADELEKEILKLDLMPYRFPQRQIGIYANKGYHQLFVKNYTVIYRIDEASKTVIVVTVRYSMSRF